jgi:hypothetical protein
MMVRIDYGFLLYTNNNVAKRKGTINDNREKETAKKKRKRLG